MMMAFWMTVGLFCLATQAAAQEPKPCLSPSQYTGSVTYTMELGEIKMPPYRSDYDYDAIKERLHMKIFRGDEFLQESLFLPQERVHYSWKGDRCSKEPIDPHFELMGVPENATFLSQVVLGTSSIAGHGLVVNNWRDNSSGALLSFTDADCLPVSYDMEDPDMGVSVSASFFNNLLVYRPEVYVVPDICKHIKRKTLKSQKRAGQKETEIAINRFLSFFQKQGWKGVLTALF